MSTDEDDLTLRLLLKGLDPGQAQAIAQDAGNQFSSAMQGVNAKLLELHEQQGKLLLASDIKYSQQRIDEEIRKGQVVQKLIDEQTSAEAKAIRERERADKEHMDVSLANLAHLSEVVRNFYELGKAGYEAIAGVFERFKGFAEDSIKATLIYDSLKGSIEGMRTATQGAVTDIDLITTRNRAMLKDLTLTDEQFADTSKVAMAYAHALGVPVKEALDSVIDGLATGRIKTLQHAGVMIDAKQAQLDFAESIGTVVGNLTEEQKKYAVQEEALRKIAEKAKDAGEETENTATKMEQGFTAATNAWNSLLVGFGHSDLMLSVLREASSLAKGLQETFELISDAAGTRRNDKADAEIDQQQDDAKKKIMDTLDADLRAHGNRGAFEEGPQPLQSEVDATAKDRLMRKVKDKPPKRDRAAESAAKRAAEKANKDREFLDDLLFGKSGGASGEFGTSQGGATKEDLYGSSDEGLESLAGGASKPDESAEQWAKKQNAAMDKVVAHAETKMGKAKGGMLSRIMFGEKGTDEYKEAIASASDTTLKMMDELTQFGEQAARATGAVMNAAIMQSGGATMAIHNELSALGKLAQFHAIEHFAKGLGYVAEGLMGNPVAEGAAAAEFVAAAKWEVGALVAGAGAASIGTGGSAGGGRASTASPPINRGSGLPSSTQGAGGSNNGGQPQTIIINQTILPGGEAEAGMRVRQALQADFSKTGMTAYPQA